MKAHKKLQSRTRLDLNTIAIEIELQIRSRAEFFMIVMRVKQNKFFLIAIIVSRVSFMVCT